MSKANPYNPTIADEICELIATTSKSVPKICEQVGISYTTHSRWLRESEEYQNKYARAKEDQIELFAEELLEAARDKSGDLLEGEFGQQGNSANVQRSKLEVDTLKWLMSKLKPKKYGDRVDVTSDGEKIKQVDVGSIVSQFLNASGNTKTD